MHLASFFDAFEVNWLAGRGLNLEAMGKSKCFWPPFCAFVELAYWYRWNFTGDRCLRTEELARYYSGGMVFFLFLLLGSSLSAAEKPLGTVFYSPEERRSLVAVRNGVEEKTNADEGNELGEAQGVEEKPKSSHTRYTVSGIVSRSGGKSVAWINGQPVGEVSSQEDLPHVDLSGGQVVIDGKTVKVGESIDITFGEKSSTASDSADNGGHE